MSFWFASSSVRFAERRTNQCSRGALHSAHSLECPAQSHTDRIGRGRGSAALLRVVVRGNRTARWADPHRRCRLRGRFPRDSHRYPQTRSLCPLVKSHQRKGVFLREASRSLKNVAVVTDRAENLLPDFDWVVSRAVSPNDVLKLKLANNFAALVGADDISKFDSEQAVPWGTGRHLAFHVERS